MTSVSTLFFGQPRLTKWMRFLATGQRNVVEIRCYAIPSTRFWHAILARDLGGSETGDVGVWGVRRAFEARSEFGEGQAPTREVGPSGHGTVLRKREGP